MRAQLSSSFAYVASARFESALRGIAIARSGSKKSAKRWRENRSQMDCSASGPPMEALIDGICHTARRSRECAPEIVDNGLLVSEVLASGAAAAMFST